MRELRSMASWVLALFLTAMFLWIAVLTLAPYPESKNVVFTTLAEKSGIALWEPTGRFVVGCGDVLAALLIFIPWTRRIGAVLAALISAGAVAMHLTWLGRELPVEKIQGLPTATQIKNAVTGTDGGQLFYLALALLAASVLLIVIHPGKARKSADHG